MALWLAPFLHMNLLRHNFYSLVDNADLIWSGRSLDPVGVAV